MIEITGTWGKAELSCAPRNRRATVTAAQCSENGARKSYLGLLGFVGALVWAVELKQLGHSHQVGQRPRAHFLHDVAAVYLHGNLGETDLCRDRLFMSPKRPTQALPARAVSDAKRDRT
jgi:hypothetical protein